MLDLPRQSQFNRRDEFAAAVSAKYDALVEAYHAETVSPVIPDWAASCQSVTLPLAVAREGGEAHALAAIVRHAIETGKTAIGRIARVEQGGNWSVFFEAR